MQDQIIILKEILLGIWSKKHYIILSTWLICPIAWYVISQLPDQYESEARVYVDTQSLLRPLMKGLMVETNPQIQIQLMVKTLLSRPNLERIARMNDLDLNAVTSEEFEGIIDGLKKSIAISRTGRENIFTITSVQKDPQLSKDLVQSALTVFIENTLGETRQDSDSAQQFLDKQIQLYESRLVESEIRLKEFKQKYHSSLPENAVDYSSALAMESAKLKESELALEEAKTRLKSANQQLIGEEPVFGLYSDPSQTNSMSTQFDSRIIQLEEDLDDLLLRYTEKYPDVIEIQRRLSKLTKLRDKEIEDFKAAKKLNPNSYSPLNENPVYQEMKIQANQLENDVASLEVRVANYKERIQVLQRQIISIPEVDAEFMALNRDYSIIKDRYEELLKRQESAQIGQQAEHSSEKIQFRVIDPPKLPLQASGPFRSPLFIATFIASIAVGGAISFLLVQMNPKVISTSQLTRSTNLPIFGVISATKDLDLITSLKRKKRLFFISNIILLLCLVALVSFFNAPGEMQTKFIKGF